MIHLFFDSWFIFTSSSHMIHLFPLAGDFLFMLYIRIHFDREFFCQHQKKWFPHVICFSVFCFFLVLGSQMCARCHLCLLVQFQFMVKSVHVVMSFLCHVFLYDIRTVNANIGRMIHKWCILQRMVWGSERLNTQHCHLSYKKIN